MTEPEITIANEIQDTEIGKLFDRGLFIEICLNTVGSYLHSERYFVTGLIDIGREAGVTNVDRVNTNHEADRLGTEVIRRRNRKNLNDRNLIAIKCSERNSVVNASSQFFQINNFYFMFRNVLRVNELHLLRNRTH